MATYPVGPNPVLPNPVLPNPVLPNPVLPNPVLVVGYGNSLRGDDGVGQVVARALWSQRYLLGPHSDATIVWAEQLVPEMALELSQVTVALFVDAACDGRPAGTVAVKGLRPATGGPLHAAGAVSLGCWQDLTPASLLALCADLYGKLPAAGLITVSVDAPGFGAGLSPSVGAAVPAATRAARSAIKAFCPHCAAAGVPAGRLVQPTGLIG